MMYDFKKLADVELLSEVPEGASAFVEVDGAVKRVPGSGLGGGGVATAILRYEVSDERIATRPDLTEGVATAILRYEVSDKRIVTRPDLTEEPFVCDNYTYEQAKAILDAEQPLAVMLTINGFWLTSVLTYVDSNGYIRMVMISTDGNLDLYWDANGFYLNQSE